MVNKEPKIFVISGPSAGVGKSSIVKSLLEIFSISGKILNTTTRKPREGEKDLKDFRFVETSDFVDRFERNEFLEAEQQVGYCYGTLKSDFEEALSSGHDILFWILDVKGMKEVKQNGLSFISIFIDVDEFQFLERRLKERGLSDEEIRLRLEQAKWELNQKDTYDHVVLNRDGNLEDAITKVAEIVRKETG